MTKTMIYSTQSRGVALAILGSVILVFGALPIFLFVAFNYLDAPEVSAMFWIVPALMGFMGMSSIVVGVLQFTGKAKFGRVIEAETSLPQTIEDRLDELERLKRRDMVTPDEYAAKRQDILKDL